MQKRKAIIIDLDGTVAYRFPDKSSGPIKGTDTVRSIFDYDRVHEDHADDTLCDLIWAYWWTYRDVIDVLIVTGRPDSCRDLTRDWLNKNNIPWKMIFMRETGDKRHDYEIKEEIYNEYIKDKWDVEFVLEDRTRNVEMWRSNGLMCLQVADGNF